LLHAKIIKPWPEFYRMASSPLEEFTVPSLGAVEVIYVELQSATNAREVSMSHDSDVPE